MSYDGRLGFGLLGDYDAMPDLEALADDLRAAIDELSRAAGLPASAPRPREGHRLADRRSTPARAELGDGAPGAGRPTGTVTGHAHRPRPDQRHRRRHRRQRGARSASSSRARARPAPQLVALPRAGGHRLPARGPAAQGALPAPTRAPRSSGSPPTRRASSRSSASPSAPTTSTTPRRCSPTASVQADLPQGRPAELRRLRRAALLPARRRAAAMIEVDGVHGRPDHLRGHLGARAAGDRRGAGRRAR